MRNYFNYLLLSFKRAIITNLMVFSFLYIVIINHHGYMYSLVNPELGMITGFIYLLGYIILPAVFVAEFFGYLFITNDLYITVVTTFTDIFGAMLLSNYLLHKFNTDLLPLQNFSNLYKFILGTTVTIVILFITQILMLDNFNTLSFMANLNGVLGVTSLMVNIGYLNINKPDVISKSTIKIAVLLSIISLILIKYSWYLNTTIVYCMIYIISSKKMDVINSSLTCFFVTSIYLCSSMNGQFSDSYKFLAYSISLSIINVFILYKATKKGSLPLEKSCLR